MRLSPLTKQELEKVKSKLPSDDLKVYSEDVIEAEFLMKFGFSAYWALYPEKDRSKGIDIKEMTRLLIASRKVDASNFYVDALASFIGAGSAQTKNPSHMFKKLTRNIIKSTKVE